MMGPDQSDWMITQLRSVGRVVRSGGPRNIVTLCASPSHADSNPSMSIRRDGRAIKCWSCGFTGSWNKIATLLGMQQLPGTSGVDRDELAELAAQLAGMKQTHDANIKAAKLPVMVEPWTRGSYRGYSQETLALLDTRLWFDFRQDSTAVERILWPFYMHGQLVGGAGRVLTSSEPTRKENEAPAAFKKRLKLFYRNHPKYRNLAGTKAQRVLYPFDLKDLVKTVVLVEGPTSAIRLIDMGLPALAILGSENWTTKENEEAGWSSYKAALLLSKGVQNVVLCFDGDEAGRKVAKLVTSDLEQLVAIYRIDLPTGTDPDDCPPAWRDFIHREVTKLAT